MLYDEVPNKQTGNVDKWIAANESTRRVRGLAFDSTSRQAM